MKLNRSVSFDEVTLKLLEKYMKDNEITNFSKGVNELLMIHNELIKSLQRWKKIALTLQGRTDLLDK